MRDAAKASSDAMYAAMQAAGHPSPPLTAYSIVQTNVALTDPDQFSAYSGSVAVVQLAPGVDLNTARMQIQDDAGDYGDPVDGGLSCPAIAGIAGLMAGWGAYDGALLSGVLMSAPAAALMPELLLAAGMTGLVYVACVMYNHENDGTDGGVAPMDPDAPWANFETPFILGGPGDLTPALSFAAPTGGVGNLMDA